MQAETPLVGGALMFTAAQSAWCSGICHPALFNNERIDVNEAIGRSGVPLARNADQNSVRAMAKSAVSGPALPLYPGGVEVDPIFEHAVHYYICDAAVK